MGYKKLRYFGCTMIGDILAYAPPEKNPSLGDFYFDVNHMLTGYYDTLVSRNTGSKKMIIAHSLGCQISFTFAFRRELDLLVTMGNPMNYFSLRYEKGGKYPDKLKKMINFYNSKDPISTIVSNNPVHKKCLDFNVGSYNPYLWLPMKAHGMYWESKKVLSVTAAAINSLFQ